MRHFLALFFCFLFLAPAAPAQAPALLQRRVRLAVTDAPLEQVLRDIARQSGVPFSYSSTFIPLQKRVTLHTSGPQPVTAVLTQLLGSRNISYQLVGGQIVLWRTGDKPPFPAPAVRKASRQTERPEQEPAVGNEKKADSDSKAKKPVPAPNGSRKTASGATREAVLTSPGSSSAAGQKPSPRYSASQAARSTGHPQSAARGRLIAGGKTAAGSRSAAAVRRETEAAPGSKAPAAPAPDSIARPQALADSSPQAAKSRRAAAALAQLKQKAREQAQAATTALARTTRRTGQALSSGGAQLTGVARALADSLAAASAKVGPPLRSAGRRLAEIGRRDTLASRSIAVQSGLAGRDTLLPVPAVPPAPAARPYYRRPWQVSFIAPLGSNGLKSGRTVNTFSLNVLAGYSAGLKGAELGGLVNVARDTVQGAQLAGLLNVVGTEVKGVQLAGLFNVIGGSAYGIQAAGLGNIGRDDVRGLQVAGLVNIGGGAARSRRYPARPTLARRLLGLPRLLATDSAASAPGAPSPGARPGPLLQAAGLANLTGNDVTGLQTAPLVNVARQVRGAQFGLLNVSKHVRGVQLGLVNVADSVDGVSLGIINIVRHGYLHGEVWASESLPLNAVLKLGVRHYYTLLGGATEPFGSRFRWAIGLGVGTATRAYGRFTYSLDLMHWSLEEPSSSNPNSKYLIQLRPAVAWQIEAAGHLQLVLAPTLNLALAYSSTATPEWDFGQNQKLLIDTHSSRSLTRLWPGLQLGIRF